MPLGSPIPPCSPKGLTFGATHPPPPRVPNEAGLIAAGEKEREGGGRSKGPRLNLDDQRGDSP